VASQATQENTVAEYGSKVGTITPTKIKREAVPIETVNRPTVQLAKNDLQLDGAINASPGL
jgi:hypothetical protein